MIVLIKKLLVSVTRHLDSQLLLIVTLLLGIGLITIYSASAGSPDKMISQLTNVLIALLIMWAVANVPLHYLSRIAMPLYVIGLILLICVELFGEIINGAQRWLDLGFIYIQPSELMKVSLPLMLAWYFDR